MVIDNKYTVFESMVSQATDNDARIPLEQVVQRMGWKGKGKGMGDGGSSTLQRILSLLFHKLTEKTDEMCRHRVQEAVRKCAEERRVMRLEQEHAQ